MVVDNHDPKRPGGIKVRLAMLAADAEGGEVWARLAVPMAGANRGTFFLPEVDDEVLVAFEAGDVRRPYIVGALWNGQDTPPIVSSEDNNTRAIVSRSGIRIILDDDAAGARLILETPGGRTVVLDDAEQQLDISDNLGNEIRLDTDGITIKSSANVTVQASTVKIETSALEVNTAIASFSGTVKCDTMIANSVVATSYTPGAGNIW
jgi:uncharacterized protein involved in type VI secretion and phage assembly